VKWGVLSLVLTCVCSCLVQAQTQPKTFTSIEDSNSGWGSCSDCAGGQNLAGVYWMAPFQTSPSRTGNSTQFHVSASNPFSNVLFWRKLGPQDWATHLTWDFWIYLDKASQSAQSLEYDAFQFAKGMEYMFGTQCVYASGRWDVWNQKAGKWVQTSLACNRFSPNAWHHIVWQVHRTSDNQMHYDSVTLDGVKHVLNVAQPAGPMPPGWTDNLGVQWQMDTAGAPLTLNEWVDHVKLTVQ